MDQQVKEQIENSINNNDVCLFMKGSPEAPQCGFSMAVSNILKILEVKYQSVDVLKDQKIREGIKIYSCLLYTSPSPRDVEESRMPSSA